MKKVFRKTTMVLGFLLCLLGLFPQANPALALENGEVSQEVIDAISAALTDSQEEILAISGIDVDAINNSLAEWQKNVGALTETIEYLGTIGNQWEDETWNHLMEILNQAGIATDELFPSIAGCIHDAQGNPMKGVLIAMVPNNLVPLPSFALTGNGTVDRHPGNHSSFGFSAGLPTFPVFESFVPEHYRDTFNQGGCYWIPVPPDFLEIVLQTVQSLINGSQATNSSFVADIFAIFPGYTMAPQGKRVKLTTDGKYTIESIDQVLSLNNLNPFSSATSTSGTAE